MSDINNQGPTGGAQDDLDAAWGGRGEGDAAFGAPDDGGHFSSMEKSHDGGEANEGVVDVSETTKEKKAGSPVGMIVAGVVGLLGLGAAGYIGMSLYSKISPAKPSYQQNDRSSGLPDSGGQMQGDGLIPGGSNASNPAMAGGADAAAFPGASNPVASTAQRNAPVGPPAEGASEPVINAANAATSIQNQVVAAAASPAAVSMASAGHEPPKSPQGQAAPTATAKPAAADVICPAVEATPVAKKKAPGKARSQVSQGNSGKEGRKHQTSKVAKKKTQKESGKKTTSVADSSKEAATTAETKPRSTGSFNGYKLMSIWPKTGEFQQATVKDLKGANHVVRAGDSIDGIRVRSVNAASYEVETDSGVIR